MDILKEVSQNLRQGLSQDLGGRKVFKRSEIEQKRLQRLREEEKREDETKALRKKQLLEQQRYRTTNNKSKTDMQCLKQDSSSLVSDEHKLSREEVIRRLRFLKHPVTLFGEDDLARLDRLKFVLDAGLFEVDDISDMSEGQTNDFLRHVVELKKNKLLTLKRKATDEGDRASDLKKMKANFDELCDEDKILVFFNRLLNEWNQELDDDIDESNDEEAKKGMKSKMATFMQCDSYLKPLFHLCRKRLLAYDMKRALLVMVECCMKRDYQGAMDQYFNKIAIGNAPWPIGVTNVGIHERSAREKIHTSSVSVAHIMNDETTRKYLHSLAQLVTLCQRRYPTMPSKCVEFNSLANGSDLQSLRAQEEGTSQTSEEILGCHGALPY